MELEGQGGAENPGGRETTVNGILHEKYSFSINAKKKKKAEDQDVYFLLMSRDPKWYMRISTGLHVNLGENKQASIHFSRSKPSQDPYFQKQSNLIQISHEMHRETCSSQIRERDNLYISNFMGPR